jgi:hypothetical protein
MARKFARRIAPSIKSLLEVKDMTREDAKRIRDLWHNTVSSDRAWDAINEILRTCGVEWLGIHRRSGLSIRYANAGDTYATTLISNGPRLYVGCRGDLVERNMVRSGPSY